MKNRLLVSLDAHWPADPACDWVLLGPDGRPLEQGRSTPAQWPAATTFECLLRGAQVLWHELAIPRTVRANLPQIVRQELEDVLLDVDAQHLVITHRQPGEAGESDRVGVLAIARARLQQVIDCLGENGRRPDRLLAELQTAPADATQAHLSISHAGGVLRTDIRHGIAVDRDDLGYLLSGQLHSGAARPLVENGLQVHLASGVAAWPGLPEPASPAAPYAWWAGMDGRASNLLTGEFASRGGQAGPYRSLRLPLALAVAALTIWLGLALAQVLSLRHQEQQANARSLALFQEAFPGIPPIAPAAQMQTQLNDVRSRHGQLRDDDALALLERASRLLGPQSLKRLRFEDGRLELQLAEAALPQLDALLASLKADGLLVERNTAGNPAQLFIRADRLP